MKYDKDKLLGKDNKVFCILPWIHSYIHTDGNVRLCCISSPSMGKLDSNTRWEDIWNSQQYKEVRKAMLQGEPLNPYCYQCYNIDALTPDNPTSQRAGVNRAYERYVDTIVQTTNADGSLDSMDIKYIDIRWNNICNFKCRMCSNEFSSLIAAENLQFTGTTRFKTGSNDPVISVTANRPNFLKEILPHVNGIDCIYFAGGEPLVTKEHYEILDYMIKQGLHDVRINYSTNLSKLKYDGWDVIEQWKQFKTVNVRPSLDSWGTRAEYIRTGTKWKTIEQNLHRLFKECPHIEFSVASCVSAFSAPTYAKFIDYMIQTFKIGEDVDFSSFILDYPKEMNVDILPREIKQTAVAKIKGLIIKYPNHKVLHKNLELVISALSKEAEQPVSNQQIKEFIDTYDQRRATSFVKTFPELREWYNTL